MTRTSKVFADFIAAPWLGSRKPNRQKRVALYLSTLNKKDREWILKNLPKGDSAEITSYLEEIKDIGLSVSSISLSKLIDKSDTALKESEVIEDEVHEPILLALMKMNEDEPDLDDVNIASDERQLFLDFYFYGKKTIPNDLLSIVKNKIDLMNSESR